MAMAIALAAVAAQAEAWLTIDQLYSAGTYDRINAHGYLIYSDTLSQSDAVVAAFYSAGASYESTIASSAELRWDIHDGYRFDHANVSSAGAMYALCFYQDSNYDYMYVSPVANSKWDEMGAMYTYKINAGGTSSAPPCLLPTDGRALAGIPSPPPPPSPSRRRVC